MIFIVRTRGERPPGVRVVLVRHTPSSLADAHEQSDLFCVDTDAVREHLGNDGWQVVDVHDGWYADDHEGGVAVWGQGRYWEVRPTPFEVSEHG